MKPSLYLIGLYFLFVHCAEPSSNSLANDHETIVIGGGLMGSATAWQLAKQGQAVLLLEKQDSIYQEGSSYGQARIARSNNRGHDMWSYLHNTAVAETQILVDYLQGVAPDQGYAIDQIYNTNPVTYVGRQAIYDQLLASLLRQEIDYALALTPEEGQAKFDVQLPQGVLIQREYNPLSGTLNPQQLIRYLHRAVLYQGQAIRYNTGVENISFDTQLDRYIVHTTDSQTGEKQRLYAKNIVSAAGPYTGRLLKDVAPYFAQLIQPQRVFLAFLKNDQAHYRALDQDQKNKISSFYPVINSARGTRANSFFSMIEYYDEAQVPVLKIGGHFQRTPITDLDTVWRQTLSPEEIAWSRGHTADYHQLLNLPLTAENLSFAGGYSCVYSITETEVPLVTPIVQEDGTPNTRFIVLGGMSGVGAKGAMAYGKIAASWMYPQTGKNPIDQRVKDTLGFKRLKKDLDQLNLR